MIRFKQRMSLCSEISSGSGNDSPLSSPSITHQEQAQRAEDSHSPPALPAISVVPPVIIAASLGRVDSSASLQPPPSSDSSLSSSGFDALNNSKATTHVHVGNIAPLSHVEIHPETKIPNFAAAAIACSSTPPATTSTTVVISPSNSNNNTQGQLTGKKRTVSDATDEQDSSSSSVGSDISPIASSNKRPRTHQHQIAKDSADSSAPPPRLLACPADPQHLNPLHCFVRRQIELFAATAEDVAAPCPGRKVKIQVGQVGLRCIHCKRAEVAADDVAANTATDAAANPKQPKQKQKQKRPRRVKRALCYPSKVARIYNSVSDMKFDHFGMCPHMPQELRGEFGLLKALHVGGAGSGSGNNNGGRRGGGGGGGGTVSSDASVASSSTLSISASTTSSSTGASSSSSSSSTARYYHETALLVGLVDAPAGTVGGGIRFGPPLPPQTPPLPTTVDVVAKKPKRAAPAPATVRAKTVAKIMPAQDVVPVQTCVPIATKVPSLPQVSLPLPSPNDDDTTTKTFPLAAPEDEQILNPIHCFIRRNVEVFAATAADIAAPAPGRKNRIVVGQVGIRCVHCAHLPPRDRVKRSICYPPNVSGIYHAVSNMKFDHFSACRGLDGATRAEFQTLRASCGRKGGGRAKSSSASSSASRPTTSSSTAQYYHDSALNLGLVDTSDGIRFLPEEAAKLRAAAAMVIQAHKGPPSAPSMTVPVPTKVQIPLTSAPLPPLGHAGFGTATSIAPDQSKYPSSLPNFAQREPIPDGLSALMMAASQRSAEYAPQMAPQMATTKLAI